MELMLFIGDKFNCQYAGKLPFNNEKSRKILGMLYTYNIEI